MSSDDTLRARVASMEESLLHILRNKRDGRIALSSHHDELDGIAAGINMLLDDLRHELGQTRDQLRQAQKMEAIGHLAGGVAHDFNNLLQVIIAHVSFLGPHVKDDDDARADLGQIEAAATRARDLTRQLLTFARRQPSKSGVVGLNTIIEQSLVMLRPVLGASIEVTLDLEPQLWPVPGDGSELEQILVNLLMNARDAMPDGGPVTVRTRNLSGTASTATRGALSGHVVALSVEDKGCGIPPEALDRVFEPFFTTKPRGQGTGLGLAVCYGIATQLGGELVASSTLGKGSTFTLALPRATDDAGDARAPTAPTRPPVGEETILVVEDQPEVKRLLERGLSAYGYKVLTADDGEAALEVFEAHRAAIALVVTDIDMPRLGGAGMIRQLVERGVRVPFLVVTGHAGALPVVAGASVRVLEKPFLPEVLARLVRDALTAPRDVRL